MKPFDQQRTRKKKNRKFTNSSIHIEINMETTITPTIHSYPSQRSKSSSDNSEKRPANELIHH